MRDPQLNKSTAFTTAEREALGLTGSCPLLWTPKKPKCSVRLQQLGQKPTDLERYIYLIELLDTNETLFYKALMSDPARFLPIVYDPTVGEACLKFGHIFRRPRGMYLSFSTRAGSRRSCATGRSRTCTSSASRPASASSAWATSAPTAWASRSASCSSTPPAPPCRREYLLPVTLDVGTNNDDAAGDPLYLGLRQPRVSTDELTSSSMSSCRRSRRSFRGCCLHFEDWPGVDAMRLLARYRDRVCCYNDDIQGTAGVALAGLSRRPAGHWRQTARPAHPVPGRRFGRRSASPI